MNGVSALQDAQTLFTVKAETRVGLSFRKVGLLFVPLKKEWLLRIIDFVYIVNVIDNGNMNVIFINFK